MASFSRKLLTYSSNETLYELCYPYCDLSNDLGYCRSPCVDFCFAFCPFDLTPPPSSDNNHPSKMLVAILTVLAAAFVLVTCYALYSKVYLDPLRRTRTRLQDEGNERRAEFLDEDHGPVVDHPIWYINTIGLQPSVISSITIFEYKKGVGLAEGTDCAVCLNEFEDSETLRLLPKCSHAFHIPCIDTWLRSHTNCPLCRAPIVASTARLGSVEGGDASVGGREGTRIDVQENGGGLDGETGSANGEFVRDGTEEFVRGQEKIQSLRRSVSMDSISALKIAMAMENAQHQMESREDDSGSQSGRAGGNHRLVQFMASSSPNSDSGGRSSEAGSSSASVIRSFSCSGELFSARYNSRTISLCDAPPRKIAGSST